MFCSNQKFLISGDKDEMLRKTLHFALEFSGWTNAKHPQPTAYSVDPVRGVVLYWHENKEATTIPTEMRNEESIFLLIKNYLNSSATKDRYIHLRTIVEFGPSDSWFHNGWECYIPESILKDEQMGLPLETVDYAIVAFRPAITRYDK